MWPRLKMPVCIDRLDAAYNPISPVFPPCTGRVIARLSVPTPALLPGFFCQKSARGTLPGAQACGLHGRACPPREAAPRPNQYPRLTAGGRWPPRARHGAPWIPTAQPGRCCIPTQGVVPLNTQPTRLTPGGWKPPRAGARCPTPPSNLRSWISTKKTIIRRFALGDQAPHCVWCAYPPTPSTRGGEVAVTQWRRSCSGVCEAGAKNRRTASLHGLTAINTGRSSLRW
jgi:hypothetical protein